MTIMRPLSSQERDDLLEQFQLSQKQAEILLSGAQIVEVEAGEPFPVTNRVLALLSGGAIFQDEALAAPALIPSTFHVEDRQVWLASERAKVATLDRLMLNRLLVTAIAEGETLPCFEPVFSEQLALRNAVEQSHVLSSLPRRVALAMQERMSFHHIQGGERILNEGDPSDSLYIVVIGRLVATRKDEGNVIKLAEIGPSGVVGEIGLMVDINRTADVNAMRDSLLAKLSRADFEQLLITYPIEVSRVFAHALYSNLDARRRPVAQMVATTTVLVPCLAADQAERTAESLRKAFESFGRCFLLRSADFQKHNGNLSQILAEFSKLEREASNILILADNRDSDWTGLIARQADRFVFLAGDEPIHDPDGYKASLLFGDPSTYASHSILRVNSSSALLPQPVKLIAGALANETRIYPVREGNSADFARTARFLSGRAVGLVLGGGAARGLAHIGVLRALEELKIPIDIVGGNSMGALIGSQYAFGVSPDRLLETTRRMFGKGERPAFPSVSLLSGKGMERGLIELFGDIQIEQLWRPFFAVACSISTARIVTLDRGPLWRGVRASNSPAGLLPPIPHNGELLIDGAVMNNVPTDVMRSIVGDGKVIAVAVDKREELMVSPKLTRMTTLGAITSQGMPDNKRTPRITEILARAGAVGGVAARARLRPLADLWLEPPVSEYSMIAYHKSAEIAEVGYRYAMKELSDGSLDSE